ncbi:MAG TPA: type VI secretion system-associated FHA domain protein TagH [Steroidobacteraceae bacterium]|nr:type VI secretion system-associated FHA domain protein TagH [Steroidobacteraceae bacterium]
MALRLKIVSDNAAAAGAATRWTFGVNGGRIGRSESNDWVLRDPERYVSGRHAEIEHRAGTWWLRDTSTNGTFVNDSDEALGPDQPHKLANGDRIRIGEYEIEVEISGSNDFLVQDTSANSQEELQQSFEARNFMATKRLLREQVRRPVPPSPPAAPAAPAVSAVPVASARAREEQEMWPGLAAFCKGAGIDPRALPPEVRASALAQAGQLLRETLVGFSELARTRADFAGEFNVSSGARRRDATSPLLQLAAVEQVLELMLAGRGPGDSRAIDEVRAQFARARHHEMAIAAALREAIAALLQKLDPDELEQQFGRRGAAGPDLQARLWERYRELFRATAQAGDAGLPAAFLAAFARAYESITAGGTVRDPGERDD